MTGSDNVCYVVENERLSEYDPDIKFTNSQSLCAGEGADSAAHLQPASRACASCAGPLTKRWQKRTCSKSCAAKLTPLRRQDGIHNGNYRGGISATRPYAKEFYARRPEVLRAQRQVADAIRRGALVRPEACSACGLACKPDAHHPDYSRPLFVEWLCPKCHVRRNAPRKDRVGVIEHGATVPSPTAQFQSQRRTA